MGNTRPGHKQVNISCGTPQREEGSVKMKTITIHDVRVAVSNERINYSLLRNRYAAFSNKYKDNFLSRYSNLFSNTESIEQNLNRISNEYLIKTADAAVADLISNAIFDIDDGAFLHQYEQERLSWTEDIASINQEYLAIALGEEAYNEYQASKRSSSGGIIGGGFGLEGAAAGMAIATAANVALGTAASLASSLAKGLNSYANKISIQTLFNREETKRQLARAVFRLVFNAHYAVAELINSRNDTKVLEVVGAEDSLKSKAITNNLTKSRVPDGHISNCLASALGLDPFNHDIYAQWKRYYESQSDEADRACAFFGVDGANSGSSPKTAWAEESQFASSQELRVGLLTVLESLKSDDYFAGDAISERKTKGARSVYFTDPDDDALALIDCTILGSAECGIVFGRKGLYWAGTDKKANFQEWATLVKLKNRIEKKFFSSVGIGEYEVSLNGAQVSKEDFVNLLSNVLDYISSR